MNIDEYAWNRHEQKLKEQVGFTSSKSKIKIVDAIALRNKVEEQLENLPQKSLCQWAIKVATPFLAHLDLHLKDDLRIITGLKALDERLTGNLRAYDFRKVGFTVNELAKESESIVSRYAARSFAQAIATGHMRGHAMVSSDYAIKVVNTLTNESLEASTNERERQLKIIEDFL